MKINSVRTKCWALLATSIALVLVNGSTEKDAPLERVAGYKQWTRAIPQLPAGIPVDLSTAGG